MITEIKLFKVTLTPTHRESNVRQVDIYVEAETRDKASWAAESLPAFIDQDLNVTIKELLVGYKNE